MGILMEIQVKKMKGAMLTILERNFSKLIQLLSFQTEEQLQSRTKKTMGMVRNLPEILFARKIG